MHLRTCKNPDKENIILSGQTVHFVSCKRVPQQGLSLCLLLFFRLFLVKILKTCLKTCLWNPEVDRHQNVRLSNAQVGFLMLNSVGFCMSAFKAPRRSNFEVS